MIGVGASDVADQVWFEAPQGRAQGIIQPSEIIVIGNAVGQVYVD
jgi:hypothetical protein